MRRCQRDCQEFISVDGVDQDRSGCWTIGLFPPVIVSGGPRTRSPGRRHMARVGPVYEMPVFRKVAPRRPEVLGGGASLLAVPYAITGGLAASLGPRRAPRPRHDVGCSWWCFGPSWHQLY